jgi:hypothetical protein
VTTTEAFVLIACAVIGSSGIPVWFLKRLDRKNTDQHGESRAVLDSIREDVTHVKNDVSEVKGNLIDHLDHHLRNEGRDGSARRVDEPTTRAKVRGASNAGDSASKPRKRVTRTPD